MTDAPERIWTIPAAGTDVAGFWDTIDDDGIPYIIATPAALADAPEVQAMIAEAVAREREACAAIADAYADENLRMAGDSVLFDPVLGAKRGAAITLTDIETSNQMITDGCVHSSMFHASQNVASAIRARGQS